MSIEKVLYTAHPRPPAVAMAAPSHRWRLGRQAHNAARAGRRGGAGTTRSSYLRPLFGMLHRCDEVCRRTRQDRTAGDTSIEGSVGIGAIRDGFGIEVTLKVSVPGLPRAEAESLVQKAHVVVHIQCNARQCRRAPHCRLRINHDQECIRSNVSTCSGAKLPG